MFPPLVHTRCGFTISTDSEMLDVAMIHRFLSEETYWAPGRSRDIVERSIKYSLCFGVYCEESVTRPQVGFARVVSDFATFAYLADVFVLPNYRGRGLGEWLIETALNHPQLQSVSRWALYTKDAHALYRRFGFGPEQEPERYMSFRNQVAGTEAVDQA